VDFLAQNWWLVLLALGSGAALAWPMLTGRTQGVAASEAVRLMNHKKAVVIDVSEPAEFAAGHVVGSRNLPVGQIETATKVLPTNKTLPVVVVCPTGSRAGRAAALIAKLGHEKVVVLQGGLAAWREANLPTEKAAA
jgi:rhodanese-related sulfurtransferase